MSRSAATASDWSWEDDELTRDLVRELQAGSSQDTRAFLRPLFKWMKAGVRKNGQKNDALIEKSFAFVDWMVQLSRQGDPTRGIAAIETLQPNYALNTIVTASQRAGSLPEAKRAFEAILQYGFEPDVFTYTALIDVTARNGDVPGAIKIYEGMRSSRSKPNIVTITTLIRSIGYTTAVEALECVRFLEHARQQETFDEVLYLDALDACALRNAMIAARAVLQDLTIHDVTLRNSERLVRSIARVLSRRADKEVLLGEWLREGIVTQQEIDLLGETSATPSTTEGPKSLGCLGNQTSDSVRLAVVQHDINRLVERISTGAMVTANDFETLIHQCRKRKWKEEVGMIVSAMRDLATQGWEGESPAIALPVQPHLMPTSKTYVSVVDAYLASGDESMAWAAFQEVGERAELVREQPLYRKYIRGCYLLTNCTHIRVVVELGIADGITFTNRMCTELARMHGYLHTEGIDLVANLLPVASIEKKQRVMEELVTSCAYKHNTDGVRDTILALARHGLSRSAKTEMAAFLCCLQHPHYRDARDMLHAFQSQGLMLDIPMYGSLLREMYFKYTRRGSTFDDSSRVVAIRTLQLRRALFESAIRERDVLENWIQSSYHQAYKAKLRATDNVEASVSGDDSLQYWCQLHALECAPLMFTQHVVEVITTIRDKESKLAKQQTIREALLSTPDPYLFNLRAVVALRQLDLTYRGQGKLAKQLMSILEDVPAEPHHIDFCLSHLRGLSVHIVKELDDVIGLHRHDERRVLDYCLDALESDNVDKTIGFVVSKETLYTVETARFLIPKLAEVYVVQGVVTVLQFFKPDVDHATEIKRLFLREVVDVESLNSEGDEEATMPLTRRAITEFKMEHEAEFMPFVMSQLPREFTLNASPVDDSLCLQCPLPSSQIIIVDQDDTLALAYDVLMEMQTVRRIGIDAEWRPDARGYAKSRCSVLQIACDSRIFLFDLVELAIADLEELFSYLFGSESVLKLGYALDGDIKRLQWSFEDVKCFDKVENVLDFAHDDVFDFDKDQDETVESIVDGQVHPSKSRRRQRGLSALVAEVLGSPLNKTQQKSDWEKRPLSDDQIKYAALDAYCLLMLHDKVQ